MTEDDTYEVETYVYVPVLRKSFHHKTITDKDCKVLMTKVHKELYLDRLRHSKLGMKEIWHFICLS